MTKNDARPVTNWAWRTVPVGVASTAVSFTAFQSPIPVTTWELAWVRVSAMTFAADPVRTAADPKPLQLEKAKAAMPAASDVPDPPPSVVETAADPPLPAVACHM